MCPKCSSKSTINKGSRRGIKRYKCTDCNHNFSSKRRGKKLQDIIFKEYFYKRQTYQDLAIKYGRSITWIKNQIDSYEPPIKKHNPREINLVCDATFYAKRKDKLGTLVFKDNKEKEILIWKHIESEKVLEYKKLLQQLLGLGYIIKSVTFDGKRGLTKLFSDYPVQMCHFHEKKIIQRYLTKNPRLQAGKDLKKLMYNLTTTNEKNFTKKLDEWIAVYEDFIEQLTTNPITGETFYTHQKVRAAYKSLRANLPYLFTYKNYKKSSIPNTTNTLDGGTFSPMKKRLNVHSGMSVKLRFKLVDDYLVNYKKK